MCGWHLHSMDMKTALLQGEEISRDVYLRPAKEAETTFGKSCKLKKWVYSLSDAFLQWYGRVEAFHARKWRKND